MAPDSVWTVSPPDSLAGTIEVCWTPVEGAEGYQVVRRLQVHVIDGELLEEPVEAEVPWSPALPPDVFCATVDALEGSKVPWSVEALHDHPTAVGRRTWGAIKHHPLRRPFRP